MKHGKRVLSVVLCLLMLVAIVPVMEMRAISQSDFDAKVSSFKSSKYANNSTYVNNSSYGGYQCFGFANELASWIFDSFPTSSMSAYTVNTNWTRTYGGNAVDSLALGDIVRYKYHSIFITGISGDTIYYAQANVPSGTNKVTYDNSVSRSSLKSLVNAQLTHDGANTTGWVAHCNNGVETTHTHSYKEGYEGAHPHRVYMKCSCGDYYYTGATTTMSGCQDCLKPTNVTLSVDRTTLHQWQTITFESNAANVDSYAIGIDLNGKRIVTQKVPHFFYYKCEESGNYTAYISARNSYGYTDSAKVKFTVTPHTYDNGRITKAATCITTGVKTYTCTVCNATKTETIAVNASNHVNTTNISATASTCTVKGYTAGVYCNDCKKYISGHAEQAIASHTLTTVNQKAAGCTTAGYTGDQVCTTCNQTTTKGSAVAALGHANADSKGNCTRCGTHIKDVTPSQPSNPQPNPNACKYCGQVHSGPFGWLIKFFHSILAIFKR